MFLQNAGSKFSAGLPKASEWCFRRRLHRQRLTIRHQQHRYRLRYIRRRILDIKSFVAAKAPKSDVQYAATVAYYYRFEAPPERRRHTIDGDALQEAARLAGRPRLSNPRATLNNAKTLGYLDSTSPGEFGINSVGENLVAMALPGNGEAGARGKTKKAKKTKKSGRKG